MMVYWNDSKIENEFYVFQALAIMLLGRYVRFGPCGSCNGVARLAATYARIKARVQRCAVGRAPGHVKVAERMLHFR